MELAIMLKGTIPEDPTRVLRVIETTTVGDIIKWIRTIQPHGEINFEASQIERPAVPTP